MDKISPSLKLLDSRRLTGPNLWLDRPGAVIEVEIFPSGVEAPAPSVVVGWESAARRMLDAVGWSGERTAIRRAPGGASLALSAPLDALYAATEVNEWAWEAAVAELMGEPPPDFAAAVERLRGAIAEESNPTLLAIRGEAAARAVTFLADDDRASVGLGRGSLTWDLDALPSPTEIDWTGIHDIPVALVTGTNGKTTTVRMLAEIARAAGIVAGTTTTDRVAVGDEVLDRGDYSGPNGARLLLRDRRVELAVLETARGGLLRRGLALQSAVAAAITNVADDHLGEFGVADLAALAETKLTLLKGLRPSGRAVLNADDPEIARLGEGLPVPVTWFSLDAENPLLRRHRSAGGDACWLAGDELMVELGGELKSIARLDQVPATFGGAARHNVANALTALGLAAALGLPTAALRSGLAAFRSDPFHNPGRANLFALADLTALVDYAHNPHGVQALRGIVESLPAGRRVVLLGHAGDREEGAIRSLARAVWELRPARVVVKEMPQLLRGRPLGEIPAILTDELRRLGATAVETAPGELEGVRQALRGAQPGDLLVLLVHAQRDAVLDLLGHLRDGGWKAGDPLPL
jgi:UDP-N-acetylmuramyl tripeptide synthase